MTDTRLTADVVSRIIQGGLSDEALQVILTRPQEIERLAQEAQRLYLIGSNYWATGHYARHGHTAVVLLSDNETGLRHQLVVDLKTGDTCLKDNGHNDVRLLASTGYGIGLLARDHDGAYYVRLQNGGMTQTNGFNGIIIHAGFIQSDSGGPDPIIIRHKDGVSGNFVWYRGQEEHIPDLPRRMSDIWGKPAYVYQEDDWDIVRFGEARMQIEREVIHLLPVMFQGRKYLAAVTNENGTCWLDVGPVQGGLNRAYRLLGEPQVVAPAYQDGVCYYSYSYDDDSGYRIDHITTTTASASTIFIPGRVRNILTWPDAPGTACAIVETGNPNQLQLAMVHMEKTIDQGLEFRFVQPIFGTGAYLYAVLVGKRWTIKWGQRELLTTDYVYDLWVENGCVRAVVRSGRSIYLFQKKMTDRVV